VEERSVLDKQEIEINPFLGRSSTITAYLFVTR
jgi:hypothetical protein